MRSVMMIIGTCYGAIVSEEKGVDRREMKMRRRCVSKKKCRSEPTQNFGKYQVYYISFGQSLKDPDRVLTRRYLSNLAESEYPNMANF